MPGGGECFFKETKNQNKNLKPRHKFKIIRGLNKDIAELCRTAGVSKSGYYKFPNSNRQNKDYSDYLAIKKIFDKGRKKLGWRPIQMALNKNCGLMMNHKKIRRIMNKYQLYCQVRRKNPYRQIMRKTREHRTFGNILGRNFQQLMPKKVLCTDITFLYYGLGRRAYLSAVKDIASGEAVSWEISTNLELEFVLNTVKKLKNANLDPECMIHSDQGFHYTSPLYIQSVKQLGLIQSMSRKGNCIDNAPMESFFGHLKDGLEFKSCSTFEELTIKVNEYMQYYNHSRYQWGLKKMTPVEYRSHLLKKTA